METHDPCDLCRRASMATIHGDISGEDLVCVSSVTAFTSGWKYLSNDVERASEQVPEKGVCVCVCMCVCVCAWITDYIVRPFSNTLICNVKCIPGILNAFAISGLTLSHNAF